MNVLPGGPFSREHAPDPVEQRCRPTSSYGLLGQGSPAIAYTMNLYPLCDIICPLAKQDGSRNPGKEIYMSTLTILLKASRTKDSLTEPIVTFSIGSRS